MRRTLAVVGLAAATILAAGPLQADEARVEHYGGKPAPNLEQAVKNLHETNRELETRLSQEMTESNMDRIHRLSYTLENALKRLDDDLDKIADVLEGMHLASERMNADAVQSYGSAYLENMQMVLGEE
jgi:hypothetical protein